MKDAYDVHRYTLHSGEYTLNARTSRRSHTGALVRHGGGHGCIHPWPELGDGTLEEELHALATGRETPLTNATRRCIELDGRARRSGRWLFAAGHTPPECHATLPQASHKTIEDAAGRGFKAVKVKGAPDRLEDLKRLLENTPLPLRIDFNESMSLQGLLDWSDSLTPGAEENIEFVEDPCPYDPAAWTRLKAATGWRLALDRQVARAPGGFDILVIKPAISRLDDLETWLEENPTDFVVTSYMDHPLGQAYAAHEATRLSQRFPQHALLGGLATHHLFPSLPRALYLGDGPNLTLPEGTGLGFDNYLHSLPWQPLTT